MSEHDDDAPEPPASGDGAPDPEEILRAALAGAEVLEPGAAMPRAEAIVHAQLARLDRSDLGNAHRLVFRHGDDLAWSPHLGWLAFDGRRWAAEEGEAIARRAAHRTVEAIGDEADALEGEQKPPHLNDDEWLEHCARHRRFRVASGQSGRVAGMLREAEPKVYRALDAFDRDAWLLNVANGTLELAPPDAERTQPVRLREHRRADLLTCCAPTAYDPAATAPAWAGFLAEVIPDAEARAFVQRFVGYALTGDIREDCLQLLKGAGRNGKSTFVDVLRHTLGVDYVYTIAFESLLVDRNRSGSEASPDIARLRAARLVCASEPEQGSRFSEGRLKHMTGGEPLIARHLNRDFFEFAPQFKLLLSFNNAPQVRGSDVGIWSRFREVTFPTRFYEADDPERPARAPAIDRGLDARLRAEAPGVLNWALDGFRAWRAGGLAPPASVRAAVAAYREEQNPLAQFLAARTALEPGASIGAKALYDAYEQWAKDNAVEPVTRTAFGRRLAERDGVERDKAAGLVVYLGLRLVDLSGGLAGDAPRGSDDWAQQATDAHGGGHDH